MAKNKMQKNEKNLLKEQPLISVIIPVYKVEKYIHRCVDSVLQQTYENLEVILVDDGSPDRCGEICNEYAKKDLRVKVIHQKNVGLSEARNAGINISHGKYIAFVDSDDYIVSDMYEKMAEEFLRNRCDICVCQWQYENEDGRKVVDNEKINHRIYGVKSSVEFAEFFYQGQYENGVVCATWNKLYKKEIFENVRFKGKYLEDDRIHNEILSKNYKVVVVPEMLYIYCQNNESLTKQPFREESLMFLDILVERMKCFASNEFILNNSKILYCNMYIEYYYKAEKVGLKMRNIKDFEKNLRELILEKKVNLKFIMRMLLFRVAPGIYKIITNINI